MKMEDTMDTNKSENIQVPDVPNGEKILPGKGTTEYFLVKVVMVACIIIAVLSSMGKVPFTPDEVLKYLTGVMTEAGEWVKVLMPYVTALVGGYAWLRTDLKKKALSRGDK